MTKCLEVMVIFILYRSIFYLYFPHIWKGMFFRILREQLDKNALYERFWDKVAVASSDRHTGDELKPILGLLRSYKTWIKRRYGFFIGTGSQIKIRDQKKYHRDKDNWQWETSGWGSDGKKVIFGFRNKWRA